MVRLRKRVFPIRIVSKKRRFWTKRTLLIALSIIVIAGLLWCAYALNNINKAATTDPMQKADVGIILGMSMWGMSLAQDLRNGWITD